MSVIVCVYVYVCVCMYVCTCMHIHNYYYVIYYYYSYSILQADNTNGLFYIDSDSGELFLASTRELDYESVKSYNIYVQASDRGDPIMNT